MTDAPFTAQPISLYLHVPFCASKCAYCDFTSAPDAELPLPDEGVMWAVRRDLGPDATLSDAFCAAVPLFLQEFADAGVMSRVPSVYIGGGTPTVLGSRLPRLLEQVLGMVRLAPGAEVTVEANPDSVTAELAEELLRAGATRFSLGVQSFDDAVLATLGRRHDSRSAEAAACTLVATGAQVSLDLICGVPGQSVDSWRESLERGIATGVGHLSVYPLSIEVGTPLESLIESGSCAEPDPDVAAEMMEIAAERLTDAGFERYEVASYARPGQRAVHNVGYWTGVPYLGVGPGAASMLPVPVALRTPMQHYVRTWPESWRARFTVNDTLESFLGYLWDRQPATLEALSDTDAAREDAMLGLRMSDGISDALASEAGATEVLRALEVDGLLEHDDHSGRWRTTERGWLLGNEVFSRVWAGE